MSHTDLPDGIRWVTSEATPDGSEALEITTPYSTAKIETLGALVTSFVPSGGEDLLWMSPLASQTRGKATRGGVPICFPWFGNGIEGDATPQHGVARRATWRLISAVMGREEATITFGLTSADVEGLAGAERWPSGLAAHYVVRIGQMLRLELTASNTGTEPIEIEEALHTYLAVDDVRECAVVGLSGSDAFNKVTQDDVTVLDDIAFTGEVDLVVMSPASPVVLEQSGEPMARVTREGSGTVVVWNPGAEKARAMGDVPAGGWHRFVCIESANVGENFVSLGPGESHTLTATYAAATSA